MWREQKVEISLRDRIPELASIRFPFSLAKAVEAAAVLLQSTGDRMPYMRLIKLLYLADRESLHRYGRPIVGGRYVAMKLGPVTSEVLDEIKLKHLSRWQEVIEKAEYDVKLRQMPRIELLSDAEIAVLKEVADLFRRLDQWALSDVTHALPEWRDPGASAVEIAPEDILRALQKSEEQIEQIREEAVENEYFGSLFNPGSSS
jgi:uncharacterized phage-associated protein